MRERPGGLAQAKCVQGAAGQLVGVRPAQTVQEMRNFGDLGLQRHGRIQRQPGFLWQHGQLAPPKSTRGGYVGIAGQHLRACQPDPALGVKVPGQSPHDRVRQNRLARA